MYLGMNLLLGLMTELCKQWCFRDILVKRTQTSYTRGRVTRPWETCGTGALKIQFNIDALESVFCIPKQIQPYNLITLFNQDFDQKQVFPRTYIKDPQSEQRSWSLMECTLSTLVIKYVHVYLPAWCNIHTYNNCSILLPQQLTIYWCPVAPETCYGLCT